MTSDVERQLMRLLHDELPAVEAARWRRRLDAEPELAALYADLESVWHGLELPEPDPAGAALATAVRRRLEGRDEPTVTEMWRMAPIWNRALAAAALAVGVGIGSIAAAGSVVLADESLFEQTELSLAESYWLVIEEDAVDTDGEAQP